MSNFKARGVVIRETEVGETDKLITVLCKTYGKIYVRARGARKPKSKFLSGAQLFTYADYVIFDGGRFYSLSQADVIDGFFALRADYERLCLAQYFVELCDKTIMEKAPCDDILHLLIVSLSALAKAVRSPMVVARVFELKLLQFSGLAPETERCAICGGELAAPLRLGPSGAVCGRCASHERGIELSSAALLAMSYILQSGFGDMYKFTADSAVLDELKRVNRYFLSYHFEARIKSERLI